MSYRIIGILVLLLFSPIGLYATDTEEIQEEESLNPKELIFEHVQDAYEWHFFSWGEKHFALSLPIIVRAESGAWHCFSSHKLSQGKSYKGFYIADKKSKYAGKVVEQKADGEEYRPLDFSITKNVVGLWFGSLLLCFLILSLAQKYKKEDSFLPAKGFWGVIDGLVSSVYNDVIKPCVGEQSLRFAPYLLTAFFFIFINNLLGLIPLFPGGANVTGNIAITMVLALFTFLMVNVFGSKAYWKDILWPDVPMWMKCPIPLMPLIEFFGLFTKPFALMVRLFANITAGHSIILGLMCLIFISAKAGAATGGAMTFVAIVMSIFMNFLELLVAYIQAYVFTMLSAVFIGLAQENEKE